MIDEKVREAARRLATLNADLLAALKASRIYVQDCIENGHDKTMLANLYGARDEIDAALAGKAASSPTSGVTQAAEGSTRTPPSDIREALETTWTAEQILRRALANAAERFGLALTLGVDWIEADGNAGMVSMAVGLAEANAALSQAALTLSPPADGKLRDALDKALSVVKPYGLDDEETKIYREARAVQAALSVWNAGEKS